MYRRTNNGLKKEEETKKILSSSFETEKRRQCYTSIDGEDDEDGGSCKWAGIGGRWRDRSMVTKSSKTRPFSGLGIFSSSSSSTG